MLSIPKIFEMTFFYFLFFFSNLFSCHKNSWADFLEGRLKSVNSLMGLHTAGRVRDI